MDPQEVGDTPPPAYYKGDAATRIGDIQAPPVRAKFTGDYLEMMNEHPMNGSDHRAVIVHLDTESFLGNGPPGPLTTTSNQNPRGNIGPRTRGKQ